MGFVRLFECILSGLFEPIGCMQPFLIVDG